MMTIRQVYVGAAFLLAGMAGLAQGDETAATEEPARGIVVEEVDEASALAKAGVQPGDVLLSWRRLPSPPLNPQESHGELRTFFDWLRLEIEQAPRATVELTAWRQEGRTRIKVSPGSWRSTVRPWLQKDLLDEYLSGLRNSQDGKQESARNSWRQMLTQMKEPHLIAWLQLKIGRAWENEKYWQEAHEAYNSALESARVPFIQWVVLRTQGLLYEKQGEAEKAIEAYTRSRELAEADPDNPLTLAEILRHLGDVANGRGDLDGAEKNYLEALEIQEKIAPVSINAAFNLNNVGAITQRRGNLEKARQYFQRALAIHQGFHPSSASTGATLNNLGIVAQHTGNLEAAESYFLQALEIKEKTAPDSASMVVSLNNLGTTAWYRGHHAKAAEYFGRGFEIQTKISPRTRNAAILANNLGMLAVVQGDRTGAEAFFEKALEIYRSLGKETLGVAGTLNNLGANAHSRGHLDRATDYFRQALEIRQRVAPKSVEVAEILSNLGNVSLSRKNLIRARDYFLEALEFQRRFIPDNAKSWAILNNAGNVAEGLGYTKEAEGYYQQALNEQLEFASNDLRVAEINTNIAGLALKRGDHEKAISLLRRAWKIKEKLAPGSLSLAHTLNRLGAAVWNHERSEQAVSLHQQALAIRQLQAPFSAEVAETFGALGEIFHQQSQVEKAEQNFLHALDVLDMQLVRLGGSHDSRGAFRARFNGIYQSTLNVQLERDLPGKAFYTLERSRSRTFLEQVVERDIIFTADVPKELDSERRHLAVRLDRTQRQLAGLNPLDDRNKITGLHNDLRRLRTESEAVEEQIRSASPRLAALQYPHPFDLNDARTALDPGTLMLSYSVGETSTILFVVSPDSDLRVVELKMSEARLRGRIDQFRRLIADDARIPGSGRLRSLEALAQSLFDSLLAPIAKQIQANERLLILSDGPLHYLPWGALRHVDQSREYFLAEWKPVHLAMSATVYADLRKHRRSGDREPKIQLAAFGDVSYPALSDKITRSTDLTVRSAAERTVFDWTRLPYSRREVEGIASVFPRDDVRIHLGDEATEDNAKALGNDVRIVHFAVHADLDERIPQNSFLALTIPEKQKEGRDNGLLQVWEIYERLRLDADLVVLSACQTAMGAEQRGEGLIGLTRAFQYAGARTVMASLWNVNDQRTAELMVRFYRHLRDGKTKDEALRAAQLELLRGPIQVPGKDGEMIELDATAPYYWAAFQLYGDWR